MRCRFCGWDNPDGKENCEKCGKALQIEASEPSNQDAYERPTTRQPKGTSTVLKATVREKKVEKLAGTAPVEKNVCPECGYKLEDGVCSSCGYNGKSKEPTPPIITNVDSKKTVRPQRKGEKKECFVLTPISEDSGQPEGDAMKYVENEVLLNRENTDPKNSTITSQCQALITNEDGKWYILDQSEYKTTFVQAARKIEINSGDLILLGNQLFRFDNIKE